MQMGFCIVVPRCIITSIIIYNGVIIRDSLRISVIAVFITCCNLLSGLAVVRNITKKKKRVILQDVCGFVFIQSAYVSVKVTAVNIYHGGEGKRETCRHYVYFCS